MVYPRKRCVPKRLKEGAVSGTLFMIYDNSWMNKHIYMEWFRHFVAWIPRLRKARFADSTYQSS